MDWREVDDLEVFGVPIIYWTRNKKCGTFNKIRDKRDWDWKIKKYNILFFQYLSSVGPVGILGCDEDGWYSCEEDEMYELYKDKRHVTPDDIRQLKNSRKPTILSTVSANELSVDIEKKLEKHHIMTYG